MSETSIHNIHECASRARVLFMIMERFDFMAMMQSSHVWDTRVSPLVSTTLASPIKTRMVIYPED